MILARRALPITRSSLTHKFSVNGHEGYLTIGLYDDGTPGEIFVKMSKAGSALSGMCQAFCRAFSRSPAPERPTARNTTCRCKARP